MAACMVLALGLPGLAACGAGQADSSIIQPNGPLLTVGVASDEKGLGFWHEGAYEGLEADVARYVAQKLGDGHGPYRACHQIGDALRVRSPLMDMCPRLFG